MYVISKYGVDPTPDENPYALGNVIVMVVLTGLPAAVLGVFDIAAQLSRYSLLRVLDAALIVLFALLWIVPVTSFMLFLEPDIFGNIDVPSLPTALGLFLGGEFSLALLLILSVAGRVVARRQALRDR